jgi:hypothetical protein
MRKRLTDEEIRIVTDCNGEAPKSLNTPSEAVAASPTARTILEICTEGGGHKERQLALLPLYEEHGTVHVAASGDRSLAWAHEHWPGHRMVYDGKGSVRSVSTTASYLRRQYSIGRKAKEVSATLSQYTHAVTDFAPVLPQAMQIARKAGCKDLPTLYHVSHHAAMHGRYTETPKPVQLDRVTYWATQRYLDCISGDVNIGFHFERYHPEILTPPLSPEMLRTTPTFNSNVVLVYLNGDPSYLAEQCGQIDPLGEHEWHIYSGQQLQIQQSRYAHIWLFPLGGSFRDKLPHARAVLTLSGFMGPAELIHLGKPFVAIPTPGHGEHAFNAAALREISEIEVVTSISDETAQKRISEFLGQAKSVAAPLQRKGRMGIVGPFEDVRFEVVSRIFG